MLVEAFKIVSSIYPFIKEAFLWRDGAEAGKPVTQENLVRRKVAVFVLIGSLITNYFVVSKLYDYYEKNKELTKEAAEAKAQLTVADSKVAEQASELSHSVPAEQVFRLAEQQIDEEIRQGLLLKPKPAAEGPARGRR